MPKPKKIRFVDIVIFSGMAVNAVVILLILFFLRLLGIVRLTLRAFAGTSTRWFHAWLLSPCSFPLIAIRVSHRPKPPVIRNARIA